jgi:hypothetical protein
MGMLWVKKYRITRDSTGMYKIERKCFLFWLHVDYACEYEGAIKKIKWLNFVEYVCDGDIDE